MSLPINEIVCGECVEVLKSFPDESVDLTMFSPPYWGLRDYGVDGQIGLEEHPLRYVEKMVLVCGEVKRVLRKSGSMYIVIGDTYFGSGGAGGQYKKFSPNRKEIVDDYKQPKVESDGKWLQPKQLLGIPWRVAIALQEVGWILRNDIIWAKPNHMPSSVTDRLTNAYEHIFHFVKSRKYYYDLNAIRVPHAESGIERMKYPVAKFHMIDGKPSVNTKTTKERVLLTYSCGKNPSDVYQGKFEGFGEESERFGSPRARNERKSDKEYPNLVEHHHDEDFNNPLGKNPSDVLLYNSKYKNSEYGQTLQAFTRENTIAKRRVLSREEAKKLFPNNQEKQQEYINFIHDHDTHELGKNPSDFWNITTKPFKGAHFAVYPENLCVRPIKSSCPPDGTVLDPFAGSGTTLAVAKKLGRKYVGIDLNPKYVELAKKRLATIPEKLDTFLSKVSSQESSLEVSGG